MKQSNIEGLDCLSLDRNNKKALVLFHGYGASMNDLAPLHNNLNLEFDYYFPQGIIEIPLGPYVSGYAWFEIDMMELEKKMRQGLHRNFYDIKPNGFDEALSKMETFLNALREKYDEIVIGGFSQGAMCSLHLAFKMKLNYLILLSGNPVWMSGLKIENHTLSFFQSHGKLDPVLSYDSALDLYKKLKTYENKGSFISFNGAHEIPLAVINELKSFLKQV